MTFSPSPPSRSDALKIRQVGFPVEVDEWLENTSKAHAMSVPELVRQCVEHARGEMEKSDG